MGRRSAMALMSVVALAGCWVAGCDSRPSIVFTPAAMRSLPSVSSSAASSSNARLSASSLGNPSDSPSDSPIASYPTLVDFFRLECQHIPGDNYCPPTVHPTDSLQDPTRFEMNSLIGMIYHAQMYTGTLVTAWSGWTINTLIS